MKAILEGADRGGAVDVVIVGGGVMGAATAYWLAHEHGVRAVVLERDPTYARASSSLSASSIRQQFSTSVNIALSQASLAFLREIGERLAVDGEAPDIGLVEPGYLYLATEAGAEALRETAGLQHACGVPTQLLDRAALAQRFPWLALDDIALGSLGVSTPCSGEGWFDGYSVLQAFRRKARALGVRFERGEATRIETRGGRALAVHTGDGRRLAAGVIVLAAGAWSAALLAPLGVDLPVRPRKRDVFVFSSPARLNDCPLLIDPSGFWFRPESDRYLCGAPPRGDDPDEPPLDDLDHGLFSEWLWPRLAQRVPAFEALRVERAWAGYYEMNTFDANGIVGPVSGFEGLYLACGFSGHGMQQAPAVGQALAERIVLGRYASLDLAPLSMQRIADGRPLLEKNVI
jgi:glycine/D-amino acid oxidase-like deaminating enzyme